MRWPLIGTVLGLAVFGGLALELAASNAKANREALKYATGQYPETKWSVTHHSFIPWASDVRSGGMRFAGTFGPVWVVELDAPRSTQWKNYKGLVLVGAFGGKLDAAQAGANNGT
jgi:hypothetical protein